MEIQLPFADVNVLNTIYLFDTCYTIHSLLTLTYHYSKLTFALQRNTNPLKGKKVEMETKKSYVKITEKVFYTPVPLLSINFSLLSQLRGQPSQTKNREMALPSRFCYNVKIINRLIISVALTRDIVDTYCPLGAQRHHSRVSIEESLLFRFPFICVDTVV